MKHMGSELLQNTCTEAKLLESEAWGSYRSHSFNVYLLLLLLENQIIQEQKICLFSPRFHSSSTLTK